MSIVRVGVIGAGNMARHHLIVMAAMPREVRAVGLVSRTQFKAQALANEFSIPTLFDSLEDMVRDANPQALMVLVSEEQAFDMASKAMGFGLPVFIEKPAGLTPLASKALADIAARRALPNMVGYNRRYYSLFHKGLALIRERGPLLGVFVQGHERFWRVRQSGRFSEELLRQWVFANSTHTIDLLRFFGGEARTVKSQARAFKEQLPDQMAAVMEMDESTIGQYQAHWYSPGGWGVALYGDGITVEFKPLEVGQWMDRDFKIHVILPEPEDQQFKPGLYGQMKAFIALVRDQKKVWPMADLADAYQTMCLTQKIISGAS